AEGLLLRRTHQELPGWHPCELYPDRIDDPPRRVALVGRAVLALPGRDGLPGRVVERVPVQIEPAQSRTGRSQQSGCGVRSQAVVPQVEPGHVAEAGPVEQSYQLRVAEIVVGQIQARHLPQVRIRE